MPHAQHFESLLTAARAGAEWAWAELYGELTGTLLGYARRQGAVESEDLVGETWLDVARNIQKFQGDEQAFRSWVFTVAHHRIIDERRRMRRKPWTQLEKNELGDAMLPCAESSEEAALRHESEERLLRVLEHLSREQREVILLRFYAGFGIAEIGKIIGKSPGAVQALQGRALRRLRKRLRTGSEFSQASSVTGAE